MQFCQPHWDKLREAIQAEGLGELIAPSGERALANTVAELQKGGVTVATFDPLMNAHWMIVGRIADGIPGVLFVDGCPLCFVADDHELTCKDPACQVTRETFEEWIPSVAAFQRREWERMLDEEGGTHVPH